MDEKKNLPENILGIKKLDLWYGENHALKNVNMEIKRNAITAFIGNLRLRKIDIFKDPEQDE